MLFFSEFLHNINQSTYKLDAIGVVGLFGGDRAADALETIHLYTGRRWAGWYNYPGSMTVAMRFGQMARSRFWDTVFPGPNGSPAAIFNLAGRSGPDYSGVFSGTKLGTGYPGYLVAEECASFSSKPLLLFKKDGSEGRVTAAGNSTTVTIVSLPLRRHEKVARSLTSRQGHVFIPIEPKSTPPLALWAIVPSLVSALACIFSFLGRDSLCGAIILLGILTSGLSYLVLGSATLGIRVPTHWVPSLLGDGLMFPADGSIIVLKGEEAEVRIITRGEFDLEYPTWIMPHRNYHTVGISSLLLVVQVLVQFLLLPRCTFFGQILALTSFLTSGVYHLYVVSVSPDRKRLQQELLLQELSVRMVKCTLGTRAQMAVFVCLILGDGREDPLQFDPDAVLRNIIPKETAIWRYWRRKVVKELVRYCKWDRETSYYTPSIQVKPELEDQTDIDEYSHFTKQDTWLLGDLIDDAWCVFDGYPKWQNGRT